jgi:hypothetical protein
MNVCRQKPREAPPRGQTADRRSQAHPQPSGTDARLSSGRILMREICGRVKPADLACYFWPIEVADPRQHEPLVARTVSEGYVQSRVLRRHVAEHQRQRRPGRPFGA